MSTHPLPGVAGGIAFYAQLEARLGTKGARRYMSRLGSKGGRPKGGRPTYDELMKADPRRVRQLESRIHRALTGSDKR